MSTVLYARIDDDVHAQIKAMSEETGLSISKVTEYLLCKGLNISHLTARYIKLESMISGEK